MYHVISNQGTLKKIIFISPFPLPIVLSLSLSNDFYLFRFFDPFIFMFRL